MLGLIALVLLVAAWLVLQPDRPLQPFLSQPLTSLPGVESHPRFSPDGQRVAFIWRSDHGHPHQLFVKGVGAEAALQLTHDSTSVTDAAWSPEGTHLAFRRSRFDHCGIYIVSALGGPARKMTDCSASQFGLDWSPTGSWLAASYADSTTSGLVLINVATGTSRRLTEVEGRGFDRLPRFSPDGTHLAFVRTVHQGMEDLFVVPVDGTEPPRRLTTDQRHIPGLSWAADGKTLVFSSNRTGNYKLWRIPTTGGKPVWLAEAGAYDPGGVSLAPDGRMVYAEWDYEINIWRTPLGPSDPEVPASERWIASTRWDFHPRYAPDGTRIAFVSNRMGAPNLWGSQADGSDPLRLTDFEHTFIGLPSWSPDGRQIAFDAYIDGHTALFVIDADGGHPHRLTKQAADHRNPTWSRDGRWLYFASNRSGSWQLWKMPPSGGEAMPVTKDGGYFGMESADSATLYFSQYGTPGLWRMPTSGGEATLVLDALAPSQWGNWTLGPDGIYFLDSRTTPPRLLRYDPATSTTTEMRNLPAGVLGHHPGLSISPDGQWLLFANADRVESDLVLVSPEGK
jgi:Tol biopolymer transport system component